jgi:predicted DsbA family dithiol-disulfide isomerase
VTTQTAGNDVTVVELYADVECVFAHVSLRRLVARRAELGRDDLVLRIRPWPLELVNGAPFVGSATALRVSALRAGVAPDLFTGFDPEHFPATTLPAMDLAEAAYAVDVATGERVSLALRTALFEEGRDVSDPAVLAEVAQAHRVTPEPARDRARLLAEYEEGQQRGVRGSPEFFVGGRTWFCPMFAVSRTDDAWQVLPNPAGRAEFFEACFAG